MLDKLITQYGSYDVIHRNLTRDELKMFNSVVAANSELKQMTTHQLMSHLIRTSELGLMFPNLTKLAAIGLLLLMSSVDCERGFSTLSRVKSDLRNRLANKTLNHLLMMAIEGPSPSYFPYELNCL